MFVQDSSRKLLLQRHKRPNIVSSHRQEGVGPKGIRPNHTETGPIFFGLTALKMDRQKNTGLKLDQKIFFRFNFSFKKRKEAEIFLLSLGRNTHGKKGTKVTLAAAAQKNLRKRLRDL